MKRLWMKDIAMCACIILIGMAMLVGTADERKYRKQMNEKIDELASKTDAGIRNLGTDMTELNLEIKMVSGKVQKNERRLASMTDAIRENDHDLQYQINDILHRLDEQPTTEETVEEPSEPIIESEVEPQVMVASAMAIKTEHTYMEELEDSDNPIYKPEPNPVPSGAHLTKESGTFNFEGHTETYYNLDMSVVVQVAKSRGIAGEYHVRSDGAKMIGDYIMVAASYDLHPYGSLVNTSLGMGIVVDTGGFVAWNPTNLDLACDW